MALFLVTAFLVFPFGSCSPNNPGTAGSTVNNTPETTSDDDDSRSRSRSDSSDDDEPEGCDESEGDPCKDDEYCELICERIYNRQSSVRSCKDRGDETVAVLETIHDRLMGRDAGYTKFKDRTITKIEGDLEKITDDDDDIGHDELKCYLQIGANKYIEQIEKSLTEDENITDGAESTAASNRLKETFKWMVEDKEVSEILNELNKGPAIIQAVLETLEDYLTLDGNQAERTNKDSVLAISRCIEAQGYKNNRPSEDPGAGAKQTAIFNKKDESSLDQALWWFQSDDLRVWYYDGSNGSEANNNIELSDKDLFNALSCFHKIENEDNNIFSFSAKEDNEHIFGIAFNLLKESCEKAKTKQPACARALMCWTSWQKSCFRKGPNTQGGFECFQSADHTEDRNSTRPLWDMIEDYKTDLKKDGSSDYDNCTAGGFYDFFK